jgi:hypothetical protein
MRAYYFGGLLVLLLLLNQELALAQQHDVAQNALNPSAKVDSVFNSNFRSIKTKLQKKQSLTRSESGFIYVASFMAGIGFDIQSYTGTPLLTLKKLTEFESWYSENRAKIEWSNLTRGLTTVNLPPTDELLTELNSLRIK